MATATVDAASPNWIDLPFDLLRDVSSHLHDPTDYVRFHAACQTWRGTHVSARCRPEFQPWLLAPRDASGHRKARCVLTPMPGRRTVTLRAWNLPNKGVTTWPDPTTQADEAPPNGDHMSLRSSYVVESCGELLWVFLQIDTESAYCKDFSDPRAGDIDSFASALSVSVYTRQGEESSKPCWVRKDGPSLANQVLFLGQRGSFGVEAARIGMSGVDVPTLLIIGLRVICSGTAFRTIGQRLWRSCLIIRITMHILCGSH